MNGKTGFPQLQPPQFKRGNTLQVHAAGTTRFDNRANGANK